MAIGLIDVDSKIPNLALMKISKYYKELGEEVEFVKQGKKYEKIYASAIFEKSRKTCEELQMFYGDNIEIGGTGYDLNKELPVDIEGTKPDYDLYTTEIIYERIKKRVGTKEKKMQKAEELVNAGMGFTTRGCIRTCPFCVVPIKEGSFRKVSEISDLLNPRSNILILHDNNITADPDCIDKLKEIKERKLKIDINQGIDLRLIDDKIAEALSEIKHLRSLHYAWDFCDQEKIILEKVKLLQKYLSYSKQMCFTLVGFNSTFEEDMYRFIKLTELKVSPYVMVYNDKDDYRLKHFKRWVNGRIYKICKWEDYEPWVKAQEKMNTNQLSLNI